MQDVIFPKSSPAMLCSRLIFVLLLSILVLGPACHQQTNPGSNHLGELKFEVTGKPDAQPAFHKGLLLLHSFEYVDAAASFLEARTIDPDFVMAYWGEAMTYNHPIWQEQDYDKGNEVLNMLAPTPDERKAKAKLDIERDFIGGIDILYGAGNKSTRDSLYAMYMADIYKKYPCHYEVDSFYSIELNGWGTTDNGKKATYEKAAAVANEVMKRNPKHPGALHYFIHAYDDPKYAQLALETADQYAIVAPDAGHALHMPTHTYLALGQWEKVVSSNIQSWQAEKARKERNQLDNNALGYHAYHWLQYGQLQLGRQETALAMLDSMHTFCNELPSPRARAHLILLKTTYLTETNDYQDKVTAIKVDQLDLNISTRTKNFFTDGMAAYHKKDKARLDSIISHLKAERVTESLKTSGNGLRMCGNVNDRMTSLKDLQKTEVMELELRAMRAWLDKDVKATEEFFKKATSLQDEVGYAYGPPDIVKPSYELYGEWLLENGRQKDALIQFEKSLQLAPNRRLSLQGKEKSM